jgi:hypothetical protein
VPLYVLVDPRSASAAEDIPFVLQNLGRVGIEPDVAAPSAEALDVALRNAVIGTVR